MLTKMEGGADYGEVLAEAQALGFAEGALNGALCSLGFHRFGFVM